MKNKCNNFLQLDEDYVVCRTCGEAVRRVDIFNGLQGIFVHLVWDGNDHIFEKVKWVVPIVEEKPL